MLPGLRALDRRLRRLAALVERLKPDLDRRRDLLAARRIVAKAIRAGLAKAGIDPNDVPVLLRFEQPEPPPRAAPEAAGPPGALGIFYAQMAALAQRCREAPLDLAEASPAMLLATYCFGDAAPLA